MCVTKTVNRTRPFRDLYSSRPSLHSADWWGREPTSVEASREEIVEDPDDIETLRQTAKEKVAILRGFYQHAAIYILVNTALIVLNLITYDDVLWAVWPLLGWGLNLAFHGVHAYSEWNVSPSAWEERKMQEYMHRHLSAQARAEVAQADRHDAVSRPTTADETEWGRLVRRIENLEAIVTTEEWDTAAELDRASR